jgi:hypothetical protein
MRLERIEVADRRRAQHRRQETNVVQRVLGVLPGLTATREVRLERLGRELDDAIAIDAPGPTPREITVSRREHAQLHSRSLR